MNLSRFQGPVMTGIFFFGSLAVHAQTVFTGSPGFNSTSAIIGVSSTQTARLNVLNLQPVIPGVTAVACPATLEFFDDSGALLKQLVLTTISPATAANLTFKPTPSATAANARVQIRAVVFTPANTVTPVAGSMPVIVAPVCNFLSSFEVVDDATGNTQSVTTDFHTMPPFSFPVSPVNPAVK